MKKRTEGYKVNDVIEVVEMLSHSQGYYGRLLEYVLYLQENDPEVFEEFKEIVESKGFTDAIDVVLFFEQ